MQVLWARDILRRAPLGLNVPVPPVIKYMNAFSVIKIHVRLCMHASSVPDAAVSSSIIYGKIRIIW